MSVDRMMIASYLDEQYSNLAAAIGQDSEPLTGYGPDINNAMRRFGKSESELASATVEDGNRDVIFALAEYYAARRFWRQLSSYATVKVDDSSFDYKHLLPNVQSLMADAAARCAELGVDPSASGWGIGWLNLDWLEPEIAEA